MARGGERSHGLLMGIAVALAALLCIGSYLACARSAYADECPAGGSHVFAASIVAPATEDSDGVRLYVCEKCGYSYKEAIPSTGHQWGPWIVDVAPTCTSEGHEYRVCTKYPNSPHSEERIIPALSATGTHAYAVVDYRSPTCTEPGCRTYACGICGNTYTETISALGHAWGEWMVDREPTATEEGLRHRICQNDPSHVETDTVPVLEEVAETGGAGRDGAAQHDAGGMDCILAACIVLDVLIAAVFAKAAYPLACRLKWIDAQRARALKEAQERGAWL